MGKIPNFTDSERLKTPKTDCALKVYKESKTKNSISLDSSFVDLENTGERATLMKTAVLPRLHPSDAASRGLQLTLRKMAAAIVFLALQAVGEYSERNNDAVTYL